MEMAWWWWCKNKAGMALEKAKRAPGLALRRMWKLGRDDPRRAIHAVKVGLALTLVSLLYLLEPLFEGIGQNAIWAVMTVVVVLEFTAGATLCKGLNRGLGTILAGSLAFFIEFIAEETGHLYRAIFIAISVFIIGALATYLRFFPYVKKNYDYGVVIFLLTFNLITVSSFRISNVLKIAHERFITIAIGCAICLFMSLLVFPIWSSQDLHNSTVNKLQGLANSIEACVNDYFNDQETADEKQEDDDESKDEDPIYKGYKAVLDSKSADETLALYASWEPRHSRQCRYPWQQYVQVGAALRRFSYTVVALHGCLQTEIQTPKSCRALFKDPCVRLASQVAKVLKELATSIDNRTHCSPEILSDHLQKALQDLNNAIKSQPRLFLGSNTNQVTNILAMAAAQARQEKNNNASLSSVKTDTSALIGWKKDHHHHHQATERKVLRPQLSKIAMMTCSLEFCEALPFAAFASLLVETVARLDNVMEQVEELARVACFKDSLAMAATLSAAAAMDVHFTTHQSDGNRTFFFSSASSSSSKNSCLPFSFARNSIFLCRRQISITASATESPNDSKNQSLSEQLKPLSTATLSAGPDHREAQLTTTRPKSVWVNPAKPRRTVLSLHRHKRSPYQHNPKVEELRLFARKLSDCEVSEAAFASAIENLPHPPTRDNSLLILNSLKSWELSYMFFDWIKKQELFPLETIFYNVVFKSLRFGKQFGVMEDLANEMVSNGISLDNITYSTIISCAKRCNRYDKALEWFERMYKTGLMPDEVTYSAVLDVYAKLGKVEEVLILYERGVGNGWKPDPIAFSVMAKMFGEAGDYDGIRYVLQEMKTLGVQPNMVVYNNLLEAMGKAGKPGLARSLFEEMMDSGLTPNEKTLTALIKIYGKARWGKDAMELWERMRSKKWPMDFILYNTLLNMCADLGLVDDAEKLFEDMKKSENCRPDSWTYTAMLNIYGSGGNASKAMELFEVMSDSGVKLNVMGCTCLIQCLGKARKMDELVKVFDASIAQGIKPDDRLCGCLLSVVALCESDEDAVKVVGCLRKCNRPKLVRLLKMVMEDETAISFEVVKEEFKTVMSSTETESRRPFCNCLIDICRSKELQTRAHELLYLGTLFGLYPDLHNVTREEWSLDVRSLSIGAAYTALEEWMGTLGKFVEKEELPELFAAHTGAGTHKFAQGMANSFAAHVEKMGAPFRQCEERAGCFVASREDLVTWLESRKSSATATAA